MCGWNSEVIADDASEETAELASVEEASDEGNVEETSEDEISEEDKPEEAADEERRAVLDEIADDALSEENVTVLTSGPTVRGGGLF